jgi:hypothetical protein
VVQAVKNVLVQKGVRKQVKQLWLDVQANVHAWASCPGMDGATMQLGELSITTAACGKTFECGTCTKSQLHV